MPCRSYPLKSSGGARLGRNAIPAKPPLQLALRANREATRTATFGGALIGSSFYGGWTLYSPLNGPPSLATHHRGWWPTLLIFPVAGVVLGLLVSIGLSRLGATMVRSRS
jgi:hypothetical protein